MGRPVRRVLSGSSRSVDGHLSRRHVAVPLQRSTRGLGEPRRHPLSDLAPGEVYRAGRVTTTPVVSYTTLSPLPLRKEAVCSLWHCLADCSGWVLPTALPCGARTFLGAGDPATRPSSRPIRPVSLTLRRIGADAEVEREVDRKAAEQQRRGPRGALPHRLGDGLCLLLRGVHDDLVVQEEAQVRAS